MNATITNALWVFLGGGLGSLARWQISESLMARLGPGFPFGTLAVNVVGSLLMGILTALAADHPLGSPTWRLLLATGLLGGFTTYSAFNREALTYFTNGQVRLGAIYMATTLATCLLAGGVGFTLGRWLDA